MSLKRAKEKAERDCYSADDRYKEALLQAEHLSNRVFSIGRKKYYVVIEKDLNRYYPAAKLQLNEVVD